MESPEVDRLALTKQEGQAVEKYRAKVVAAHSCAGLAVGLAQVGQPDRFWTFGHRDREQELPITPQTVFGAASLTKSMTAVAIMQLQEGGRLAVLDPLVRYLPEFRTPDNDATRQITLHHLLTHMAGLPPLPTLGKVGTYCWMLTVHRMLTQYPNMPPRAQTEISKSGIVVAPIS
jgi:CubicO group peptidase (beta-lactamase class C family)